MELRTVDTNEDCIGGEMRLDPVGLAAELLERRCKERIDRPELGRASRWPGFESREIEQVLDEPLETAHFDSDRLEEIFTFSGVQSEGWIVQSFARGADRGQGRAQVVADGVEDRGLDRVGLAERLCFDGLARQPPRARCELTDDDADRQVDGERDPVLGLAERERVHRRQEEEVERQHRGDGDRNRVGEPVDDSDRDDGEHVEHAQADDRSDRAQRIDGAGYDSDSADAEHDPSTAPPPFAIQHSGLALEWVHEPVAGAWLRQQIAGPGRVGLELPSQL